MTFCIIILGNVEVNIARMQVFMEMYSNTCSLHGIANVKFKQMLSSLSPRIEQKPNNMT